MFSAVGDVNRWTNCVLSRMRRTGIHASQETIDASHPGVHRAGIGPSVRYSGPRILRGRANNKAVAELRGLGALTTGLLALQWEPAMAWVVRILSDSLVTLFVIGAVADTVGGRLDARSAATGSSY